MIKDHFNMSLVFIARQNVQGVQNAFFYSLSAERRTVYRDGV